MLKHTPMLKHMTRGVLGVMRKLMRMNCPTPWTMYGGKCSNDEQCNCVDIDRHDADEHCSKPGHLQYTSTSSTLSHTSQCATQIQIASATVSHAHPRETMNIYCGSIIEQSQNAFAIVNVHASPRETINETASANIRQTVPCETMIQNASANILKNSTSSQRERIERVALPPQHISPCATQLQDASARAPMPPPRQSKFKSKMKNVAKKITDFGYQCKTMTGSGEQHQDQYKNVPTLGQSNNKTSAVFNTNDMTSAPKGFNHLPQLKGEKVVAISSLQVTTNFNGSTGRLWQDTVHDISEELLRTLGKHPSMALALPIEDFHGYVDEDLLSWLTKFEDHFNITQDSKLQTSVLDSVKASHLIAKLQDPARSRINSLSPGQRQSYVEIVAFLKTLYLTETTKVQAMNELQSVVQGSEESVQHFANRISKLVDRANHDVSDPDAIARQKIKEFIYKTRFTAKLCMKSYSTYEEVVGAALQFEQLARIKEDTKNRGSLSFGTNAELKNTKGELQQHGTHAYVDQNQEFPSTRHDAEKHVVFQQGEIDSETYYRSRRDNYDRSQNREHSEFIPKALPPRASQKQSPDGNYSGILSMRSRTLPEHIRKDPPMTPPGYNRIYEGPNMGKIKPDSNPPTPKGFMKLRTAAPEHFTFDKTPPQAQSVQKNGNKDPALTPMTLVKNLAQELKESLTIQSQQRDGNRDRSFDYDRNRSPSRSNYNSNYQRYPDSYQDRRNPSQYDNYKRNRSPYRGNSSYSSDYNQDRQRQPQYDRYHCEQWQDSSYGNRNPYPNYKGNNNYSNATSSREEQIPYQDPRNANSITLPEQRSSIYSRTRSPSVDPNKAHMDTVRDGDGTRTEMAIIPGLH